MRALLVDDERLARTELRRLLAAHPDVEVAGEARDADEAKARIEELRPDLVFVDVQMPGRSVFTVLAEIDDLPAVVFTTAYDQYALKAFEVSALDYLLKPIVPARLAEALGRVLSRLDETETPREYLQQVFVADGERCWLVLTSDITLLEAEGNYTRLYFGAERPLVLRSLNQLEQRLDPRHFFRASRKHAINLRHVEGVTPWVTKGLRVRLKGGHEVEMSRRQTQAFKEKLGI
jgi:two-component system, LytTR family, response regulator